MLLSHRISLYYSWQTSQIQDIFSTFSNHLIRPSVSENTGEMCFFNFQNDFKSSCITADLFIAAAGRIDRPFSMPGADWAVALHISNALDRF